MTLPSINPTGDRGKVLFNAAKLLHDALAWQKWVGAKSVDASKKNIWLHEVTEGDAKRPLAILDDEKHEYQIDAVGDGNEFASTGSLILLIEADIPEIYKDNPANARLYYLNELDAIFEEMKDLAGKGGRLNLQAIREEQILRSDKAENVTQGEYWQGIFKLEYR